MNNKTNFIKNSIELITFTILLYTIPIVSQKCSDNKLSRFGTSTICELESGTKVNCFDKLIGIKKAYIHCQTGYFNYENVSLQILECMNNGEWSNDIIKCFPECISTPDVNNIQLIDSNNTNIEIPKWYVEVIREIPQIGKFEKFPGIILSEKEVLISKKFINNNTDQLFGDLYSEESKSLLKILENKSEPNYSIRIYYTRTHFEAFNLVRLLCFSEKSEEFCIGSINFGTTQYIKFNESVKPICESDKYPVNYIESKTYRFVNRSEDTKCVIPSSTGRKVETVCFKDEFFEIQTDCLENSSSLLTRCRLGFQYLESNENDYLSKCSKDDWRYEDNNCKPICGKIDDDFDESLQSTAKNNENKTKDTLVPWHVAIFDKNRRSESLVEQICGGTIIHSNIIISAGHCFYDEAHAKINKPSKYHVVAGINLQDYSMGRDGFYSEIEEIHLPDNYVSEDVYNDIALAILKKHIEYSLNIKPVCLDFGMYKNYQLNNGLKGFITGWNPTSSKPNDLITTSLTVLGNNQCKNSINPNFRYKIISDKFCTINENNLTVYPGNSGCGFIAKQDLGFNERYYLFGVVSSAIDETTIFNGESITLFSNIQYYQNFIKDIISEIRNKKQR